MLAEMDTPQEQTQTKKEMLFGDLSAAQVIATALAAVTSMLLSSQIGIAGSVIGVAVASVVATVATAFYKNFLNKSADKLRNINGIENVTEHFSKVSQERDESSADEETASVAHHARHAAISEEEAESLVEALNRKSSTEGETATSVAELVNRKHAREQYRTRDYSRTVQAREATRGAHAKQLREEREHKKKMQVKIVIAALVSGILAVAVTAGVITLVTNGEGVGEKTSIIAPASDSNSSHMSSNATNANSGDSTTNNSDTSNTTTDTNTSDTTTSNSTTTDTSNGTTDNTNGSGSDTSNSGSTDNSSSSGSASGGSSSGSSGQSSSSGS